MKKHTLRMLAILLMFAALAAIAVPGHAAKLTDKEYAELFSPVYGPIGGEYPDPKLEAAFIEDPLGFVQALAKEKYSNMFSVIDGRMGDWSSNAEKHDLRDALLQVAYGEKLTQAERRVVRWMLLCTKVMEDYPLFSGEIDHQELFSHILTGDHAGLTDEIRLAFDHDPESFVKALAKESTRVKESVLLDLALEHYYLNPYRARVKQALDLLQESGELNGAQLQIITDFWETVEDVTGGQGGTLPDLQEYEHQLLLAKGITLTDEAEIEAWQKEAEDLFLNNPQAFINALPWKYNECYHTLRLFMGQTPWTADNEKITHLQLLQALADADLTGTERRRPIKWMLMLCEDWQRYEAYELHLNYDTLDGAYASLIGNIQHVDTLTADLLGEEMYRAYTANPEFFANGLFNYTDYIEDISWLLVKASFDESGTIGEISHRMKEINSVLGGVHIMEAFRTTVERYERRLKLTFDAPAYVPTLPTEPTDPTTESDPTPEPEPDEPLKIPAVWVIVGVVAVVFGVQAVATVLYKRKQQVDDEEFE